MSGSIVSFILDSFKLPEGKDLPEKEWEKELKGIFKYDLWLKGGIEGNDSYCLSGSELIYMLEKTKKLIEKYFDLKERYAR